MTNKQNQEQQSQLSEDDYPELLLRRFKKMDSIVENARAMNRRNGLEESLQDHYIQYDEDSFKEGNTTSGFKQYAQSKTVISTRQPYSRWQG